MKRLISTVVLPLVSIVALVVWLIVIRDRLPADVATHWGASGRADGFTSREALPWLFGGLTLIVGGLMAVMASVVDRAVVGVRLLRGGPLGIVWFIGALVAVTTAAQLDTAPPIDLPGAAIPVALGAGIAGWLLGAWAAGAERAATGTDAAAPDDAARWTVPVGHTAVWSGQTPSSRMMLFTAAGLIGVALVMGFVVQWWLSIIFIAVATLLVASTSYRVTVGRAGLRVAGRLFGFPRVRVPLEQIASAESGTVDAWSYGGLGIRIRLDGESAVVTRSGPALVVTRTDGAKLSVSIDDPEQAAAVMSSLLDLRR